MHLDSDKIYQRLLYLSIALGLLILFWALGSSQLLSLNEGRRALAIKEMFASNNWLLPHLNGELYLTKPPLLYWVSTAISCLTGSVNEWTLRLPSALSALAVVWMVYRYVLRHFGHWPALFSVQLLIANAGFAMLARRVEIEMLLTALCVGALLSALEYIVNQGSKRWIYLSYLLLALALLAKGPVALLFVTLPLLIMAVSTRDIRVRHVIISGYGWALFLIVGLSWYLAVTWQLGPDIWASIAKRDMVEKMQADIAKPLLSYIAWIAIDFLLLVGLLFIRPKSLVKAHQGNLAFMIPLVAVIIPILVFSLFSNKHAKYLLPIYPFVALILAVQLGRIFERTNKTGRYLILTFSMLLPLVFAIYYMFAEARLFDYRIKVFPEFQAWTASLPETELYAFDDIDSRLIYYSNKPVRELDHDTFMQMQVSKQAMLMLVEGDHVSSIAPLAQCRVKEFRPYLKQHKSLIVFGFGAACESNRDKAD